MYLYYFWCFFPLSPHVQYSIYLTMFLSSPQSPNVSTVLSLCSPLPPNVSIPSLCHSPISQKCISPQSLSLYLLMSLPPPIVRPDWLDFLRPQWQFFTWLPSLSTGSFFTGRKIEIIHTTASIPHTLQTHPHSHMRAHPHTYTQTHTRKQTAS